MNSPETYSDVFERLERDGVRYVVISGVAVLLHGYQRPIADLDIVVDRASDNANHALRTLAAVGFVPTIPLPVEAVTVLRMFDQRNREVDLFIRYHIPFEELWSDSQRVRLGEGMVRVASLEHLIRAKRVTARPHDLEDVERLLSIAKHEDGGELKAVHE